MPNSVTAAAMHLAAGWIWPAAVLFAFSAVARPVPAADVFRPATVKEVAAETSPAGPPLLGESPLEPVADVPKISEIDGGKAYFDAKDLTTRQINLELRWLLYEQGIEEVEVDNPAKVPPEGEIKVALINLDPRTPIAVRRGDRIAQLVAAQVGVDQFNLYLMNGNEEEQLEIYGREIIPALRDVPATLA